MADGGFVHTPRQVEAIKLLWGPARHILLYGGARSGKTFLFCEAIAARAMQVAGSRHLITRFRFNHAKSAIVHDTWPKMMKLCYPGVPYELNKTDWIYTLPAGEGFGGRSEVWIGGLDDKERAEKILGNEYATILMSECSQISLASREIVRTRLAQNTALALKLFYDENPPLATHWSHRIFKELRQPESPYDPLSDPEHYTSLLMNPRDNAANLRAETLDELSKLSPRARLRFYEGKFGDATEGALWTLENIETYRVGVGHGTKPRPEAFQRIVVAVDPSGTKGAIDTLSDAIGIIVVGLGLDGHAYVLEDVTCQAPPGVWGRVVASAYNRHLADVVVGEINFGGAMVESTIKSAASELGMRIKYKEVHASRGKVARAEPISALYEQGKVHHAGNFNDLEDQMLAFTTHGYMGEKSPDRADALVWGLTELFPGMTKLKKEFKEPVVQGTGNYSPHSGSYQG